MTKRSSQSGFTLIELLIVIVIIGILASVVLSVINPARQRRRANESVLRANTNKVCLAMYACAAATGVIGSCDDLVEIGIQPDPSGTPAGSTYSFTSVADPLTITGSLGAGACQYTCNHNFGSGASSNLAPVVVANCIQ